MKIDIDMIGLVTANMAESVRFYRAIGLDIPDLPPDEPYFDVKLPSGVRLSWNTVDMMKQIEPDWVEPVGQRLACAFLCDSPAEVDVTYARVVGQGFKGKMEPWDAFWGQRYAALLDADGIQVDLFAPLG